MGGEDPVYDISLETTFDDAERVVMLVVHEKDGQIRTDCETEALKKAEEEASRGSTFSLPGDGTHQEERIDDGVYQSH